MLSKLWEMFVFTLVNVVNTLVNVCHFSVLNRESARTLTSSKLDAVQYLELIDYQTDTQTILPRLQTRYFFYVPCQTRILCFLKFVWHNLILVINTTGSISRAVTCMSVCVLTLFTDQSAMLRFCVLCLTSLTCQSNRTVEITCMPKGTQSTPVC